jgi:hypothetical protein
MYRKKKNKVPVYYLSALLLKVILSSHESMLELKPMSI